MPLVLNGREMRSNGQRKYKASLIIEKLEDKDGKKIFSNTPEHKDLLINRIDDELLSRIASAIDPPKSEEQQIEEAKND